MSKKKKLIPELRFPEFKNEGEWEIIKLKQFGTFYRGLTYGAADTANTGLLVLRSGNIQNGVLVLNNDLVFVDKECPENLKLKYGDIVICMSNGSKALVGKNAEFKGNYEGDITVGAFCSILRPKNNFTKYLLQSDLYQEFIALSIGGGNINNLKNSDLEEFSSTAPINRKEQQKIASCLSSLDKVIAAHSQKLDLLKDHKKGLMQNLFPQKGEKVPKLRFKEFEKDGEWNFKKLNKLGNLINGLTYSPDDVREEGLLVLRSSNIQNGLIDLNDSVYVRTDIQGANLSKPNDILICVRNGSKNLIGKNAIIPKGMPLSTHGAFMTVFRATNPEFIFQLFQTDFYDTQVKADLGATINSINGKNFLKYEFPVPENPKEQQKIALCLSSLDALITTQAEKIEQLKQHKKGLMQGLFPKMND